MLSNVSPRAFVRCESLILYLVSILRIRRAILSRVWECETLTLYFDMREKIELFFGEKRAQVISPFSLALSVNLYQLELRWAPSFLLYANGANFSLQYRPI